MLDPYIGSYVCPVQFEAVAAGFYNTLTRPKIYMLKYRSAVALEGSPFGGFSYLAYMLYFEDIMEYGSTPYVGMALKKMASPLNVYKMTCSKLCCRCSLGLI